MIHSRTWTDAIKKIFSVYAFTIDPNSYLNSFVYNYANMNVTYGNIQLSVESSMDTIYGAIAIMFTLVFTITANCNVSWNVQKSRRAWNRNLFSCVFVVGIWTQIRNIVFHNCLNMKWAKQVENNLTQKVAAKWKNSNRKGHVSKYKWRFEWNPIIISLSHEIQKYETLKNRLKQ